MVHTSKHQFDCYRESIHTLLLRIGFSMTLESPEPEHTEKEQEIEN